MKIVQSYMTRCQCYLANKNRSDYRYIKFQNEGPKGLMIHSVGTPQPNAQVFINNWNKSTNNSKAVHAFIDANDTVYQTLPWNYRGWHSGSGTNGNANDTYIGVEMTEPTTIKYTGGASFLDKNPTATERHVRATYKTAVELFAMLCKEYDLDPLADGVIISHREGALKKIASNHGDPEHIWGKFNLTMNQFRKDIKAAMTPNSITEDTEIVRPTLGNEKLVYEYLKAHTTLTNSAIAGILANLKVESNFISNNLQNKYESTLGYTDESYTTAVDQGEYKNFATDKAGYGLVQWTYSTRKQALLDYAKSQGKSIGDYQMQLDYLIKELQNSKSLWSVLSNATESEDDAYQCGYQFCYDFEKPANTEQTSKVRGTSAIEYYKKYASNITTSTPVTPADTTLSHKDIAKNTIYNFVGSMQYKSSRAINGISVSPGRVRVTDIANSTAPHPIHVRSVDTAGNFIKGIYGWVNLKDLKSISVSPYTVRVTSDQLNVRSTPSYDSPITTVINKGEIYTIVETSNGWGRLKSGIGWINLSYTVLH